MTGLVALAGLLGLTVLRGGGGPGPAAEPREEELAPASTAAGPPFPTARDFTAAATTPGSGDPLVAGDAVRGLSLIGCLTDDPGLLALLALLADPRATAADRAFAGADPGARGRAVREVR